MDTYIPLADKTSLKHKNLHPQGSSRQLKRIIDNRTETAQQKRILDTLSNSRQAIQCTGGELCDIVTKSKANIAADKNFTSKHLSATPINNIQAIKSHANREEQAKINTLIENSTLNLKNIHFERNLASTGSSPYTETELVKTSCNIQETELKKVEPIPSGYFDLIKPTIIPPKELEKIFWGNLDTHKPGDPINTNICAFPIEAKAPELLTAYQAAQKMPADRPKRKQAKNKKKQEIKDSIEIEIKKFITEQNQAAQQAQDRKWETAQQTWVNKVKEKFYRIGNKNIKDSTYTKSSEIDSIPPIGSKEILIGIGKNTEGHIFAFHYCGHK